MGAWRESGGRYLSRQREKYFLLAPQIQTGWITVSGEMVKSFICLSIEDRDHCKGCVCVFFCRLSESRIVMVRMAAMIPRERSGPMSIQWAASILRAAKARIPARP